MTYQQKITTAMASLGSIALLSFGYAQEAPTPPNTPLPAWKPQLKMMRFLTSLTRFSGYALQPPRGYAMQQTQRLGVAACGWQGNRTRNGIAPGLMLTVGQVPASAGKRWTPEQLLISSFNAQKRNLNDWTQTDVERGQINGITFARAYWTATGVQKQQKLRGVSYFAVDGDRAIRLAAQDAGRAGKPEGAEKAGTQTGAGASEPDANSDEATPSDVDRLLLAEAAIQTFHRSIGYKSPARPTPSTP